VNYERKKKGLFFYETSCIHNSLKRDSQPTSANDTWPKSNLAFVKITFKMSVKTSV